MTGTYAGVHFCQLYVAHDDHELVPPCDRKKGDRERVRKLFVAKVEIGRD